MRLSRSIRDAAWVTAMALALAAGRAPAAAAPEPSCAEILAQEPEAYVDAEHECEACADEKASIWSQCRRHHTLSGLADRPSLMNRWAMVDQHVVSILVPVGDMLGIMIGGTGTGHAMARYEPELEIALADIAALYRSGEAAESSERIRGEIERLRDALLQRVEHPTRRDLAARLDDEDHWRELWGNAAATYRECFTRLGWALPEGDRGALEIYRLLAAINQRFLQPPDGDGEGLPPASERPLDVFVFDGKMDMAIGREAWVRSPMEVAMRFLGKTFSDTTAGTNLSIDVRYESAEESHQIAGQTAWVTVVNDGLPDDSVQGMRYRLRMVFEEPGAWRIKEATVAWRCARGRGHQGYSAENCH